MNVTGFCRYPDKYIKKYILLKDDIVSVDG